MSNLKLPLEEIEKRLSESKAKRKITKAREEAEKELKDLKWKAKYTPNVDIKRIMELETLIQSYNSGKENSRVVCLD